MSRSLRGVECAHSGTVLFYLLDYPAVDLSRNIFLAGALVEIIKVSASQTNFEYAVSFAQFYCGSASIGVQKPGADALSRIEFMLDGKNLDFVDDIYDRLFTLSAAGETEDFLVHRRDGTLFLKAQAHDDVFYMHLAAHEADAWRRLIDSNIFSI